MKARSFPRIDRTYEIENGVLTERMAFGLWPLRPRRIGLSNTTVRQTDGLLTANVIVSGNAKDEMECIGLLQPRRFVNALELQIGLGSRSAAPKSPAPLSQDYTKARRNKMAHFGPILGPEPDAAPIRYETPMGTYIDNRDGTVTLEERGFTWIRAPWGMTFENGKFTGEPILMSWGEATELFGEGQRAKGPWGGGGTKQDVIDASSAKLGFKRGCCKVNFAGHDDWRLVTKEELDRLGVYGGPDNVFDLEWGWNMAETQPSLFGKLFPEIAARKKTLFLWSANKESSGNAWMYNGAMPPGDVPTKTPGAAILVRDFRPTV